LTLLPGSLDAMKKSLYLALVAIFPLSFALAQDGFPISTDRPSFSDGTSIIPKGRWQVEMGYTNTQFRRSRFETVGEMLVRLPVSDRMELRLSNVGFGRSSDADGWLDPVVGFKYKLLNGSLGKPEWALIAQTTVPAGSRDFRQDETQPTVKLAGYLQLDPLTGLGGNLVASSLSDGTDRFGQYAVSAYLTRSLNSRTGAFFEMYHVTPTAKDGPHSTGFDAGVTYLVDKATQVDFRIGSTFDPGRDGTYFGFGIGYRF